jgi:hypothetical protein
VSGGSGELYSGPAEWRELPPAGPEPEPGYVADFRDHPGCALLGGEARLCFNVMPDVSALKIRAETVDATGLAPLAGCAEPSYAGGARTADGFWVELRCGSAPIRVELAGA